MSERKTRFDLENKITIITGGSEGIGKATASLLAKEGAKVVIADINEANGKKAADEIKGEGGKALFVKLDVTSEKDWSELIKKTVSESRSDCYPDICR